MLMREDGSSVLRAVMDVDRNSGALIFAGTVPENSYVRFSSSSGFDVIEHVKKDIETYSSQFPEADHLILFSCMARHLALGPNGRRGDFICPRKMERTFDWFLYVWRNRNKYNGKMRFLHETFTLAVLKEKSK